jgi:pimeloyl-ACP methyl ester carboxylesterase
MIAARSTVADDSQNLLTIDHYVSVHSTVPAINGQPSEIYVREKVRAATALRGTSLENRVVLFIHGAGTPAEVAFDVPHQDYSWMGYLAQAGFDVFSMDMSGYGRSVRPAAMNDPCNLSKEQQASFVPTLLKAPCTASYPRQMTTIESDWNDIGAVVDYVRSLRHADKLSLVGWSLGGPRAAGFAAQHPDKVSKMVLLAPAYQAELSSSAPVQVPAEGPAMNTQSHDEFIANWNRQVGCQDQYDAAAAESVWSAMLQSDPVGGHMGRRRAASPERDHVGLECRHGEEDGNSDINGFGCP